MAVDVLPSSVPITPKKFVMRQGLPWVPIYCANCGADGGWIPEAAADFAFYLCVPCGDKWAPLAGTMLVPDEVFWAKVVDAQMENDKRILTPAETVEALKDGDHYLSKLARERYDK